MEKLLLVLCLVFALRLEAQNKYPYSAQFTTQDANWQHNSQIATWTTPDGSGGIYASNTSGGSVIYTQPINGSPSPYAYDAGFTISTWVNSGSLGTYTIFLGATTDASLGASSAQGSFYAVQFSPTMSSGNCVVGVSVSKYINGVSQPFGGGTYAACQTQTIFHAVLTPNGYIVVYSNGIVNTDFQEVFEFFDATPLQGHAGFGALNNPPGSGATSDLQIYPISTARPTAPTSVQTYAGPNRVDLRAFGSVDPYGPGVRYYRWYRDGNYLGLSHDGGFSDVTVQPSTQYSYTLWAMDYDGNYVTAGPYNVTTPPSNMPDPREIGTRPNGSYWGGTGEQIDMRSGNLNYSYPLGKALGRGLSVPISLSYNSQNWRLDASGFVWDLDETRYAGFGWTFQIGSVLPYFNDATGRTDHYEYKDSSGAVYPLDQNNNGVWSSKQSVYVWYDSNTNILHFRDGSFWQMGCVSTSAERDADTYYPTVIEDSNGNQITVTYAPGQASIWSNTSSRITSITDVRGSAYTFSYSFSNDFQYYLTGITNSIGSGESFTLAYNPAASLNSPFAQNTNPAYAETLASITNNNTQLTTSFTYDTNSGELLQATLPYGGHLRWAYTNEAFANNSTSRVVNYRYIQWDSSLGERQFFLPRDGTGPIPNYRCAQALSAGVSSCYLFGQNQDASFGLVTTVNDQTLSDYNTVKQTSYSWLADPTGNSYISRVVASLDHDKSYHAVKQVDQTVDSYGNVTQTKIYDYSDLNTPAKTYNTTYLTTLGSTDYTALYIRNRVKNVTVTDRNNLTTTLKTNSYDQYPSGITATPNIQQQDVGVYSTGYTTRGNLYGEAYPWGSWHRNYDQTGTSVWFGNDINPNHYVSQANSQSTNYAAPSLITTADSLNTNLVWNPSLSMASRTGANSDAYSLLYDTANRPSQTTSPYGAVTTYQYSVSAPQIIAITNGHWVKTYLDGLGRVARRERGYSSTTTSRTDFVYEVENTLPVGQLVQRSMAYVPGATPVWEKFTHDALGRIASRTRPDGASRSTYVYAGNTLTQTDPAGKWKKFTLDTSARIVQVQEPTPNSSSEPDHITQYTYDTFGHLTQVRMDRTIGGQVHTQYRTWVYDPATLRLTSKTTPESGTVTYTYNSDNSLATVTDAKSQRQVYTYDTYGRVTQIAKGAVSSGTFTEDISQRVNYAYSGTNGGYSSATAGRVSQITYSAPHGLAFTEWYTYHKGGTVVGKRVHVTGTPLASPVDLNAAYTYDSEGNLTSAQYPNLQANSNGSTTAGPLYTYTYDPMERLTKMVDQANTTWVTSATYGPSDELLQMAASGFTETRVYNANLELKELTSGTNVHYQYTFSSNQDNGQIQSQTDVTSGEAITYQYDSLQRLVNSSGSGDPHSGSWSQAFSYDGFGNLTQKTASNAPGLSILIDPATNRIQTSASYDANGNMTSYSGSSYVYDIGNRMVQANPASGGSVLYGYDSTNHRIYKGAYNGTSYSAEELYFYGADGHKYGTWQINPLSGVILKASVTKQWFGGRLLSPEDRLESHGKYFPYGEERTNITPVNPSNDQEKFATYTRDSATGLDYAGQRYFNNFIARFMQPDPYAGSGQVAIPQSWNRYAYVGNDPINSNDPGGLCGTSTDFISGWYSGCADESQIFDGSGYLGGPNDPNNYLGSGPVYQPDQPVVFSTDSVPAYPSTASASMVPTSSSDNLGYDVPVGIDIWTGQQQLWSNTATIGNSLAAATALAVAAPIAADAAASLSWARLAVGPGQPYGIHFAVGFGGAWLHVLNDVVDDFGNFRPAITDYAAEAWVMRSSWFTIPIPVVNPAGMLGSVGSQAANCFTGACYAIGQGWMHP